MKKMTVIAPIATGMCHTLHGYEIVLSKSTESELDKYLHPTKKTSTKISVEANTKIQFLTP